MTVVVLVRKTVQKHQTHPEAALVKYTYTWHYAYPARMPLPNENITRQALSLKADHTVELPTRIDKTNEMDKGSSSIPADPHTDPHTLPHIATGQQQLTFQRLPQTATGQ